jgi:hypothetical protein
MHGVQYPRKQSLELAGIGCDGFSDPGVLMKVEQQVDVPLGLKR